MIDLRSDTVTKPTEAMKEFMMQAELGDDVFSEDPTINALEEKVAAMFGKEAGIYCSSGTMTNQIAIKVHTQPGDEVICHRLSHIYNYEGGGIAFNSGASVRLIEGNRGNITAKDVLSNINPDDVHNPITSLVSVEDTCNKAGGAILDLNNIREVSKVCRNNSIPFHLDGARLFNRLVANKTDNKAYGKNFDSMSLCLSKGLGAPVGSVLVGTKEFIRKARRVRKVFGGGMRQAGIIAAAGIYALDHHIERLAEDHAKAQSIGSTLKSHPWVESVNPVDTNIVIFHLKKGQETNGFVSKLEEKGILSFAIGAQAIRFVLHLDISEEDVEKVNKAIQEI
ncbi:MAG: aminotransferase class V-fold PLP-dependent enzyme [Flavobacteriales bacterium]|nr:aminotransferase class V-fold PLP-dependent enzyme [Flavobacteriales bacterium]